MSLRNLSERTERVFGFVIIILAVCGVLGALLVIYHLVKGGGNG